MGIIYLFASKIATIGKMIAMKNCGKIASGAKNSMFINLLRSVGCIAVALVICIFSGFKEISSLGIFICILSGIANAGLLFSWVLCAEKSALCTVEIFCMIGGVVIPMFLSPLIMSTESVTLTQWIGSLLLFPAAYCFSNKGDGQKRVLTPMAVILLFTACISNSFLVLTQKLFTYYSCGSAADFNLLTFLFCAVMLGIAFFFTSFLKRKEKSAFIELKGPKKHFIIYISVAIVMLYATQYLSTLASDKLNSSYFFPLSYAIGMPLTLITDIFIYKEKFKLSSAIGIALVICGVVLIGLKL